MPNNKTKKMKRTSSNKLMTIPQLRKAFEAIEHETKKILEAKSGNEVSDFQKLWKSVFHKSLDAKAAEGYLVMSKKAQRNRRGTRKMKGGSAPIDYMLRPGIDSSSYGNYLPYISSGFNFYNDINKIAMDSDCGKVDTTPSISASMGSNKALSGGGCACNKLKGGSLSEFLSQRLVASSVPASPLQDLQDSMLGKRLDASPDPLQTRYLGK